MFNMAVVVVVVVHALRFGDCNILTPASWYSGQSL